MQIKEKIEFWMHKSGKSLKLDFIVNGTLSTFDLQHMDKKIELYKLEIAKDKEKYNFRIK